ncbi:rhamnan synthesis F family protein [Snodgrassella alvi]|uniref:rhamnan synthesis F family protein n=1 Tax=Snodgrassella alvi TaxID=1196083 RepID=UPI003CC81014
MAYEIKIKIVLNRGRDIVPMFAEFGQQLKQYDYLAYLHSKKSIYNKGVKFIHY